MIFLANTLTMNGGTTFLLRLCKALSLRGERCAVLLLRDHGDSQMIAELSAHAAILRLPDFVPLPRLPQHFGIFGRVRWNALLDALRPYGRHVHAMGVFSLLFARRLADRASSLRVTAGVYHQNEFMYDPGGLPFPAQAQRLFASLPADNVVFFNEVVRDHYADFFARDYGRAMVVPIGIELAPAPARESAPVEHLIVSIGNLVDFKTYNRHVIEMLPALVRTVGQLRYDIYGDGPEEPALRSLAERLGVAPQVRFLGRLPYARFGEVVSPATVFVGSGTALIEAAALGVPALIGIESNPNQTSYGLISHVPGLTYNEDTPSLPKRPMLPLLTDLLTDPAVWLRESSACAEKANDFSVARTAAGFAALENLAREWEGGSGKAGMTRTWTGLVATIAFETVTRQKSFSGRRNQSFNGHSSGGSGR